MKKRIAIFFLIIFSLFLFAACEEEKPKTSTSISTSFSIEGVTEASRVIILAKEKDTGEEIKIKINPKEVKTIEVEPGTYFVSKVSTESKRVNISLNEQYFRVSKSNKIISFSVKEEIEKDFIEWFFYNNSIYLLCLVGCSVFLGYSKWKENKREK